MKSLGKEERLYHTFDDDEPGIYDLRHVPSELPIPDLKDKRVLEVGTCDGWWAIEFCKRGAKEVIAIDIVDNLNFKPHVKAAGYDDKIKRIFHDVNEPMNKLGKFDFCYCGTVLCHLTDPYTALRNIYNVMDEKSTFILTTPVMPYDPAPTIPLAYLPPLFYKTQYYHPNYLGGVHMLHEAGFKRVDTSVPYISIDTMYNTKYVNGVWIAFK